MGRDEHIAAAKVCALAVLDEGKPNKAVSTFIAELRKHPSTALIITAEDDPFVPSAPFHDPKVTGNPCVSLRICRHGGHCGFVGPKNGQDDGYWAEWQIVDFVERHAAGTPLSNGPDVTRERQGAR